MAYETTSQIVSDAAVELGLVSADISNPFASTDPNILQMNRLLTSLGRSLALEFTWSQLVKEYTFSTVNGTSTYALPTDFNMMLDQSGWNRTTQFPLGGPVSGQAWQYLKSQNASSALTAQFRKNLGVMAIYPTPTSAQTIAYEYVSSFWVKPAAQSTPTTDRTTVSTDVLYFDPLLLVCGLKLAYKRAKGFDSQAATIDFEKRLEQAKNQDPAPVLSLNSGYYSTHLLDANNIPTTGFGS